MIFFLFILYIRSYFFLNFELNAVSSKKSSVRFFDIYIFLNIILFFFSFFPSVEFSLKNFLCFLDVLIHFVSQWQLKTDLRFQNNQVKKSIYISKWTYIHPLVMNRLKKFNVTFEHILFLPSHSPIRLIMIP